MHYGIYTIIIRVNYPLVRSLNFRDEKILEAFGKNLQKVRRQMNFTQEELAYESGISLSQIARIETGKINPTLCTLLTIAKTLKIKAPDLLDF
jgi:DNA-binding XRE family transcriptional regulator